MAVVTLHSGRVVNLNSSNVDDAVREQLSAYQRDGVNTAAAGFGASIQEAMYKLAGVAYDTTARDQATATAQKVIDNPLASTSASIFESVPQGVQDAWKGASDSVLSSAQAVADHLPGFLGNARTLLIVLAVSAAVLGVSGAFVYGTFKFKH